MKILVAIDDSECSQKAFQSVLLRSWPAEVEFKVFSVLEPVPVYADYSMVCPLPSIKPAAEEQRLKSVQKMLENRVSRLKALVGDDRVSGCIIEGSPAKAIVREAADWDADLVIVGSHGRTGFKKFMLGSVAEKVVIDSPCSVEIVKAKSSDDSDPGNRDA